MGVKEVLEEDNNIIKLSNPLRVKASMMKPKYAHIWHLVFLSVGNCHTFASLTIKHLFNIITLSNLPLYIHLPFLFLFLFFFKNQTSNNGPRFSSEDQTAVIDLYDHCTARCHHIEIKEMHLHYIFSLITATSYSILYTYIFSIK